MVEDGKISSCRLFHYNEFEFIDTRVMKYERADRVVIEDRLKTTLKGQGAGSTNNYAWNHGILFGSIMAWSGNPPALINPKKWQSFYKFEVGDTKGQSKKKCFELFGSDVCDEYLMHKGKAHDGKTDSALIALYAYHLLN